jgi:hypothetical protein
MHSSVANWYISPPISQIGIFEDGDVMGKFHIGKNGIFLICLGKNYEIKIFYDLFFTKRVILGFKSILWAKNFSLLC